ncbi:MAG TPA: hypothetical protein VNG33_23890, partial [Polyangiaceae bacterium]|nr:hypothetical protein [Polyangiaceae bacterium]
HKPMWVLGLSLGSKASAYPGDGMMSLLSNPRLVRTKFVRAAFAAMVGAALITGCSGNAAWAADDTDGEDPELLDTSIIRYIMKGLGLRREGDGNNIEYRERSPLVLPGNKQLPQPEKVKPASKTAGWPDDPDVKRAKQKKETEKKRKAYTEGVDDRPLLPSQYGKNPSARSDNPTILPGSGKSAEESEKPSTIQELGSKNIFSKVWGNNSEEYQPFTGEPPRANLIEPPAGYRTPSPAQPYGVGKEKWVAPKIDRQEPVK